MSVPRLHLVHGIRQFWGTVAVHVSESDRLDAKMRFAIQTSNDRLKLNRDLPDFCFSFIAHSVPDSGYSQIEIGVAYDQRTAKSPYFKTSDPPICVKLQQSRSAQSHSYRIAKHSTELWTSDLPTCKHRTTASSRSWRKELQSNSSVNVHCVPLCLRTISWSNESSSPVASPLSSPLSQSRNTLKMLGVTIVFPASTAEHQP
ncbi:hypothetical protein Mal15_12300 [Stieleria maiorica]|uniref:Uncharacterized protein n=1 Tax=Stieleria maiorica TaxID=2795974 RepID=A0A5B9M7S7_9BACT|nr:hypothetical protein Mal15_12300 [Stieleria maiorica]